MPISLRLKTKNQIVLPTPPDDSCCYIPLTRGKCALVDKIDFEALNKSGWSACPNGDKLYAYCTKDNERVSMHRDIMKCPRGMQIDHINGDTLDNRRLNLRIVTRKQNLQNRRDWNKSGFKGVNFITRTGKWRVIFNPSFDTPEEAARVYDKIAKAVYGEHAFLNFPEI